MCPRDRRPRRESHPVGLMRAALRHRQRLCQRRPLTRFLVNRMSPSPRAQARVLLQRPPHHRMHVRHRVRLLSVRASRAFVALHAPCRRYWAAKQNPRPDRAHASRSPHTAGRCTRVNSPRRDGIALGRNDATWGAPVRSSPWAWSIPGETRRTPAACVSCRDCPHVTGAPVSAWRVSRRPRFV